MYYAVGNFGEGSQVLAFASKRARDSFVAWGEADNRRALPYKDARKKKRALLMEDNSGKEVWVELT